LLGRAALAYQLGDSQKAINDLETCIQSDPEQLLAKRRLIAVYLQQHELDKARKLIASSHNLNPEFTKTTLAEIALRNNKPAAARDELGDLQQVSAQQLYLLSFCDAMEHKFEAALKNIEQAEAYQPDSSTLKLAWQVYAFADGKPLGREALLTLSSEPGIGPMAAFTLGNIAASKGDFQKASEYWRQARDLLPGFILTGLSPDEMRAASSVKEQRHLSLGMLFYLKAYYPAALSEFEKALTINRDSFMANFLYALTLKQLGDSDSGVPYLLRSVNKASGFFPANYMLAEQYLRNGDIDHAITYYLNAASSLPDQGVLIKLGLLYEGQGNTKDAAKIYRLFIKNHAESFLGYNQLAWLYAKQGIKLTEALELAHTADQIRPDNASVNDTLGWIYYQQQNYSRASRFLAKANAISKGRNPDILYHLASVKVKQRDLTQAKDYLEQALSISDDFETAAQAKQLLKQIQNTENP
jgi:tetratricopeptide (TPR) repeat protein